MNPTALILSGVLMLEHLGETDAAERLEGAVAEVIKEGKDVTYDMKPDRDDPTAVGTSEMADAIIEKLQGDRVSAAAPRAVAVTGAAGKSATASFRASPPARCSARTSRSSCSCWRSRSRRPAEGARRASPWSSTTAPSRCCRTWS